VAGPGATVQDCSEAVFKRFPLVMALIALTTFVLLVRAFRSLLLPLKAVLLNVVSVAATFGFVVLFWQYGLGSERVFDIAATGAVTFWLPVLIFAFLFGLSMDDEVFILSWWLPSWLARPLRVEPSPRRREPVHVPGQRTAEQGLPVA